MEKDPTYYQDLIAKYFSGELAGEGLSALSAWLKSDIENQKTFDHYRKTWEAIEKSKIEAIDTNSEWSKLKSRMPSQRQEEKEPKIIKLETEATTRRVFLRQAMRIAAVLIILLGIGYVILNYLQKPPSQKQLMAMNGKLEGKLPDGSTVTLNAGSTLDYPEKFTGDERLVKLKGEAFFEVTPDKSKPFKISANEVVVEVVGTSFSVNASADGNVEVIVKTGKVAVYRSDNPSEKKVLEPGDKAEFSSEDKKISESKNDDENYMAWKTGVISFKDEPLSNVVKTLNKYYDAEIVITDDDVSELTLNTTFQYPQDSIGKIINLIESSLKVKHVRSGKKIELSGNGSK